MAARTPSTRLLKEVWLDKAAKLLRKRGMPRAQAPEYALSLWQSHCARSGVFYEKGTQVTPEDAVNSDMEYWDQ